jgi:hypothetical protein
LKTKIWRPISAVAARAILAVLFGALGGACGAQTTCDRALDKVQQCGLPDETLNDNGDACEEISQCQAECILKGDCGDVRNAALGEQNSVSACADACR